MNGTPKTNKRVAISIHWIARILGIIVGSFWVMSLVSSTIMEWGTPISMEGFILAGLIAANAAGVITAWWKEKIGGIIVIIVAVSLCIFAYIDAGHHKIIAVLSSGFPFLISGILFIISWWLLKKVPAPK